MLFWLGHMDNSLIPPPPRRYRRHSPEFKTQIIEACRQPGVSIAAIARMHNLNDNMVHQWISDAKKRGTPSLSPQAQIPTVAAPPFVPVQVSAGGREIASAEVIHIELRQNDRVLSIAWPASQAHACIQALGELLR